MDPSQDVTITLYTFADKGATFLEVITTKIQNNGMLEKNRGRRKRHREKRKGKDEVETSGSGQNQR